MPRLDADTWATIRAKREGTGAPFAALAEEFGVSKTAIVKRAKAEEWADGKDLNPAINAKAYAKVLAAGVSKVTDGHQAAPTAVQMLEAEAERRASVLLAHQTQARQLKTIVDASLAGEETVEVRKDPADPNSPIETRVMPLSMDQRKERADLARRVADAVTLAQAIDRRAFGLNESSKGDADAVITVRRVKRTAIQEDE